MNWSKRPTYAFMTVTLCTTEWCRSFEIFCFINKKNLCTYRYLHTYVCTRIYVPTEVSMAKFYVYFILKFIIHTLICIQSENKSGLNKIKTELTPYVHHCQMACHLYQHTYVHIYVCLYAYDSILTSGFWGISLNI